MRGDNPAVIFIGLSVQQQAASNSKEQFTNSPDLKRDLINAIMGL